MFFKIHKLSEDQISKANTFGERIGAKLSNIRILRRIYRKAYVIGNRSPKAVVTIALSASSLLVLANVYSLAYPTSPNNVTIEATPQPGSYDEKIERVEKGIEDVFLKAQTISDSIQYLLKRGNLTLQDSIYIVANGKYLDEITKIAQENQ